MTLDGNDYINGVQAMNQFQISNFKFQLLLRYSCCGLAISSAAIAFATPAAESPPPSTPREVFNAGTHKLRDGKLREAESLLETALASQDQRLQPPALYNLGHVRFAQGIEQLKKTGPAGQASGAGQRAAQQADQAIALANQALAGDDLEKLTAAYIRGRGVRKELKAVTEVVRRALEVHGVALAKWERSSGDFKSALELNPADADAQHDAEVVDRSIAKLVDSIREMQQTCTACCSKCDKLGQKLKQLKGRIPASQMPPGAAGEEDEDEDSPLGPLPDKQEAASRDGEEMRLTPEQAGWLLEGFKLDSERRLPMTPDRHAQPRDHVRPTW